MNALFKALQDETRRSMLNMLKERDMTAGEIGERFAMSKPSVSYHLDILRQAALVSSRKEGQYVTYSLETTVLDESLGWLMDLLKPGKKNENKTSLDRTSAAGRALRGARRAVA